MSLVVDEHRQYLSDRVRLDAFQRAIAEVVRPGDVVVDLASGTGILGLIAWRAGAARVYAIEQEGTIEIARAVAAANGAADCLRFVHGHSSRVSLPERADWLICDQIGRFGIETGLVGDVIDARRRFLKPGGRTLPSSVTLAIAPIEDAPLFDRITFWTTRPAGFDFAPARVWAVNTGYPVAFDRTALLGAPADGATIDLLGVTADPLAFGARLAIERPGVLHGVGGWFTARLSPSVTLSTSPLAERRLGRRNVFFPIEAPMAVRPGDEVRAEIHLIPAEVVVTWTVSVWRGGERLARSRHSTVRGMLLSRDELARTDPAFVPSLTPRGVARRSILELCDGRRPLAEIEREVYRRHPDLVLVGGRGRRVRGGGHHPLRARSRVIYRAYGLTFSTLVRFPELDAEPPGPAVLAFELRRAAFEPGASWRASPLRVESDGTPWLTVLTREDAYALRFAIGADFVVRERGTRAIGYVPPGASPRTVRHLFVDQALPLLLAERGEVVLHGSAVDLDGAVVLLGATGAGKSTIAAAFGRAGRPILADDAAHVGRDARGLFVWPAYAGVRVWPDALRALGGSPRAPRVADYTVKRRLGPGGAGLAFAREPLPLRRLYLLAPAEAGTEIRIDPLSRRDGAIELVKHSFAFDLTSPAALTAHLDRLLETFAGLGVRRVAYPRALDGIDRLLAAILDDRSRG